MKLKYIALFIISLAVFQSADFLVKNNVPMQINDRMFFGFFGNNVLAIITCIILLFSLYMVFVREKWNPFFFWIITAAAFSNIIDRIIYGGVIDYLHLWLIPTFNLADIIIVLAFFAALFSGLKKNHQA